MTIDVNLDRTDEAFFEDLDDIIEETMVQMFIIHPADAGEIEEAKRLAGTCQELFYSAPVEFAEEADGNCVAFSVRDTDGLRSPQFPQKPLFIDESALNSEVKEALKTKPFRGIILNATQPHDDLPGLHLSLGQEAIGRFDAAELNRLPMDRIVLQSRYPRHSFESISDTVKSISNAMFRPEQSIIAQATRSSLELFGFRQ
jgi:hypothetical protein